MRLVPARKVSRWRLRLFTTSNRSTKGVRLSLGRMVRNYFVRAHHEAVHNRTPGAVRAPLPGQLAWRTYLEKLLKEKST